jgi:hypothetical protein
MIPLVPIRIDSDGVPIYQLILADLPTMPGLHFKKVFPHPEKYNIHSVFYFLSEPRPYCIIKAHSFHIYYALTQIIKGQIFVALQFLIGRISTQCNHCMCTRTDAFRHSWLSATMPHPNFTGYSHFSITDAIKVIQNNLLYPIVSINQINSIGMHRTGQFNFDSEITGNSGDRPIIL